MATEMPEQDTAIERHDDETPVERKRSAAYAMMDRYDDLNPAQALANIAAYAGESLVYQFSGFTGLSWSGVFTLAAQAGGFDVDCDVQRVVAEKAVRCSGCGGKGTVKIADEETTTRCPACEGKTRVLRPENVWRAKASATRAIVTPDGREVVNRFTATIEEPDPDDETQSRNKQKSVETKAMRNAIRRHFPAMAKTVEAFIAQAIKLGSVYVASVDEPEEAKEAAREAETRRAFAASAGKLTVGKIEANAFRRQVREFADTLPAKDKADLGNDWLKAEAQICGGPLQDAPQERLAACEHWLERKQAALMPSPPALEAEAPAYSAEGKPIEDYTPTAKELATFLTSLDPDTKNDILAKVGADPEKPMSAEQRKTVWAKAHAHSAGSTAEGRLL